MKILFIAPANSIHTVRWVNALSERNHEVVLVSLPNHHEKDDSVRQEVQVKYLTYSGTKGYYFNAIELKKICKYLHPDVINVHYASGYGTLARHARLPRIILSVWGSDVYDFPYESSLKMYIIKHNLSYASALASTSHAMARQTKRLVGERAITVTPFGVDTDCFKKLEKKENDIFTVGTIKALSQKYGIDTIIRAFAIFIKKIGVSSNAQLVLYGRGEQKEILLKLCKDLAIEKQVFFKGYVQNSEVPLCYAEIDVACFGSESESESFGVSAVEAMACEVPVIATDVDGFKEVIDPNVTGFIVKRRDPASMAEKIYELYQNSKLREMMGKAGRERVQKLYEWKKNVDIMEELYEQEKRRIGT